MGTLTPATFVAVPALLKHPRPATLLPAAVPRCCAATPHPSLAGKVESELLAAEQTSPEPPAPPATPRMLRVGLDLLNYHARTASRRPTTHAYATRLYNRCIASYPHDGRAWLGLGRLQSQTRDVDAARATFAAAPSDNEYVLQAWGVLEEKAGNIDRAKELYLSALRANPSHAASWVSLGLWQQRHARDMSAARVAFRRGSQADPGNYYVWHVWGVLEQGCKRYDQARECFQKGVSVNPGNAASYAAWGALENELGNYKLAVRLLRKAHRANPTNIHAYLSHAVAAEKLGHAAQARALLERATSLRPKDPAPRQALGLLLYRQGDLRLARETFADVLNHSPKHTETWHAWARMEAASGYHAAARRLFQEAVWAAPRSAHVVRSWHSWASMEADLGNVDTARRYLAHGLDVDPRSVALLTALARLDAAQGHMTRARETMERVVRIEPWRKSVWRQYQRLESAHGSTHRAQLVYERSVVVGQQVEERLKLSDPLPGDFQGSGMWIDALELPADKSAFDSLGSPTPARNQRGRRPPAQRKRPRRSQSLNWTNTKRKVDAREEFGNFFGERSKSNANSLKPSPPVGGQCTRNDAGVAALETLDFDDSEGSGIRTAFGY